MKRGRGEAALRASFCTVGVVLHGGRRSARWASPCTVSVALHRKRRPAQRFFFFARAPLPALENDGWQNKEEEGGGVKGLHARHVDAAAQHGDNHGNGAACKAGRERRRWSGPGPGWTGSASSREVDRRPFQHTDEDDGHRVGQDVDIGAVERVDDKRRDCCARGRAAALGVRRWRPGRAAHRRAGRTYSECRGGRTCVC